MTFESRETSVEDAQPIEIFDITVGTETFYFTTSDRDDIVFGINTYVPAVIERSQPHVNDDEPGSEVQLVFPTNDSTVLALTSLWITAAPEIDSTRVVIRKHHIGDADFQPFWFGRISSIEYSDRGQDTVILCRSLTDLFTLQGPRKTWGTQCNHQHYDGGCTLSRAAFTVVATVDSISADGLTFTLDSLPTPTVRYNAGEFRKDMTADSRLIVLADAGANTVTVQYPIPSIVVGDLVEVSEGCEHNLTDCEDYSNDINYGASPYTPPVNPFTKGLDAI